MELPDDPMMLFSMVNMKLRDWLSFAGRAL